MVLMLQVFILIDTMCMFTYVRFLNMYVVMVMFLSGTRERGTRNKPMNPFPAQHAKSPYRASLRVATDE